MAGKSTAKLDLPVGERDHILGPAGAKVTLVEYGDQECYHCRKVYPVIRTLRKRLGTRLRYVYRHFPINRIHPDAQLAAEASEAAAAQGKFWEMHELLLEHQGDLEMADLIEFAIRLDLDVEQFEREVEAHIHAGRVQEDFESGMRSGVNATPSFFINGERYDGPWDLESLLEAIQKPLGVRVNMIFQEFARYEASGGIIMLFCAILALVLANSPWAMSYFNFWEMKLGISLGPLSLEKGLIKWVNDGLMVIFFFVVGLEIKREVTTGELANPRRAMLPIMAAIGGMVVPAALYLLINAGGPGVSGWGVPMATDIAFTLSILALLGSRAPFTLKVFFTALAIVDDLGAILVIALFYTAEISWISLLVAGLILIVLIGLNWGRVYSPLPYAVLGIAFWLAFLFSGVHATIAGVLLAMTIPTRSPPDIRSLLAQCTSMLDEFEKPIPGQAQSDNRNQVAAQTLEMVADRMQSPAQRLEHDLLPWTTYIILPIFALANAGVVLGLDINLLRPISAGIFLGLVIGKPLGITFFSWLALKIGIAEIPANISLRQIFSASWLAGIGFTMALFIANSAYAGPLMLNQAKIGILAASIVAGLVGSGLMFFNTPTHTEHSQLEAAPSPD